MLKILCWGLIFNFNFHADTSVDRNPQLVIIKTREQYRVWGMGEGGDAINRTTTWLFSSDHKRNDPLREKYSLVEQDKAQIHT